MKQQSDGRPTMKDVAAKAGVALGTVSKVINGIPVGKEYREKVEAAIEALGYQINIYARGLKTSKTNCIALIIPNARFPYFASLVNEVTRAAGEQGYHLILCCSEYDSNREQDMIDMAHKYRVDGIIGLTYNPELVVPDGLPFIAIDRYFSASIPCVSSDNFGGGCLAAEKLIQLGCKRLLFMRIGSALTNEPNRRREGFIATCRTRNISFDEKILNDGEPFELFEQYLIEHVHEGVLDYDGIFCVTDFIAYHIIGMLRRMGLSVPEQVQVIGFDGVRHFGDQAFICSTIVQPVADIADVCVDMLLRPSDEKRPSQVNLPVHYASGGTTKD